MDKLKADIENLRADLSALASNIKTLGSEEGKDTLEKAREIGDRARDNAAAAHARFEQEIEQRPIASVLTSFGIGFVIGMLLDRRR